MAVRVLIVLAVLGFYVGGAAVVNDRYKHGWVHGFLTMVLVGFGLAVAGFFSVAAYAFIAG